MGVAAAIGPVVQLWGGKFMTSPELAEVEAEVGLGQRSLYLWGRAAVLGETPPKVVAELFGIFPGWLFDVVLPAATQALDAPAAVSAYVEASARWSRAHLSGLVDADRLAELLFRLIDAADAGGLALFAGWQRAERPEGAVERVGLGLTVLREYRGGLHFAALRAVGLTVPEAVVADPEGGRGRLLRTAWAPDAADALVAAARAKPDLDERWRQAQALTDARMDELIDSELDAGERADLTKLLGELQAARLG
jgi:hypothetical protein